MGSGCGRPHCVLTAAPAPPARPPRLSSSLRRFMYTTGVALQTRIHTLYHQKARDRNVTRVAASHPLRPLAAFPKRQDAFHTIMHWLHSRIPYAKGEMTLEELAKL